MEKAIHLIKYLIDFIMHIDKHLIELTQSYGMRIYGIVFAVIFIETGLVIMPFLPGDSLLFASGALAGNPVNEINVHMIWLIVFIAAVLGDSLNYEIGRFIWPKIFKIKSRFIKQEYLEKTQEFYHKHGGKAIIYARFIPIVRTFAPFVAGIGKMKYTYFLSFNILGAFIRATLFIYAGFFFGGLPFVQKNFSMLIIAIIFLSLLPMFIEWIKHKRAESKAQKQEKKSD